MKARGVNLADVHFNVVISGPDPSIIVFGPNYKCTTLTDVWAKPTSIGGSSHNSQSSRHTIMSQFWVNVESASQTHCGLELVIGSKSRICWGSRYMETTTVVLHKKLSKRLDMLTYRWINPFKHDFSIVIFIHYKPRIAVTILDL